MSYAVARVEQKIVISGVDNASDVAKKAQDSLKKLGKTAHDTGKDVGKVGATAGDGIKKFQETSGDLESTLKGIKDFAPGADKAMSSLGDAFGATEATMRLIPGTAGLVVTAVVGMALGAKLLVDHFDQARAKLQLLVDTPTAELAKSLKLDEDGAVALQKAITGLGKDAIKPNLALLQDVRESAIALKKDPAEAVAEFTRGFKGSDQDIEQLLNSVGTLATKFETLDSVARSLNIDRDALGLEAAIPAAKQLSDTLERVRNARANLQAMERETAEMTRKTASISNDTFLYGMQVAKLKMQIAAQQEEEKALKTQEERAISLRNTVAEEQRHKDVIAEVARIKSETEQSAQLAGSKEEAKKIRLAGIDKVRELLNRTIAQSSSETSAWAGKEADERWRALKAMLGQTEIEKKGISEAEKAERQAKARAGAAEAQANKVARLDANLKRESALASRDGLVTEKERLDLLKLEEAKEISGLASVKDRKTREMLKLAITEDYATKRAAVDRESRKEEEDAAKEGAKKTQEIEARSLGFFRANMDARATAATAANARQVEMARALGDESRALDLELAQSKAEFADEAIRISRDLADARKAEGLSAADLATLEETAASRRLAALEKLKGIEGQIADRRQAEVGRQIAGGASLFGEATKAIGGNVGQGLGALAGGVAEVAQSWKGLAGSAEGAISASGAVAAAFVSDEKSKAGILAATEGAAAIAAFASGNIAGGVGHTAAAAAYAGVAGGVFGGTGAGSSGSAGSVSGASGGTLAGAGNSPSGASGGQVVNIVLGKGFVIGTPAQVGKSIGKALGATKGTGFGSGKGV